MEQERQSEVYFFEIPGNIDSRVKLVAAIPSDWSTINGYITAPEELILTGRALQFTGYKLEGRLRDAKILGSYNDRLRGGITPDLFGIMVEQKLPGFIRFEEVGYSNQSDHIVKTVQIATGFLIKGYRGYLNFRKEYCDGRRYENSATCEIKFEPWVGAPYHQEESGLQPSRVRLEWVECYHGKAEDIRPIIDACRSLDFREYIPKATN